MMWELKRFCLLQILNWALLENPPSRAAPTATALLAEVAGNLAVAAAVAVAVMWLRDAPALA